MERERKRVEYLIKKKKKVVGYINWGELVTKNINVSSLLEQTKKEIVSS